MAGVLRVMTDHPMNKLRIFVDVPAPADVLEMLQEGTKGHQLVFPQTPVSSVLAKAEPELNN